MYFIVVHDLIGETESALCSQVAPCVGIHVKPREIAAADIYPNMVARLEQIRSWIEGEFQSIDLAFLHQLRIRPTVAIASAQY